LQSRPWLSRLSAVGLSLLTAVLLTDGYFMYILRAKAGMIREFFTEILAGQAPAPYAYRILLPRLYHGLSGCISLPVEVFVGAVVAMALFVSLVVLLWRIPQPRRQALFCGATYLLMDISMRYHAVQAWSYVEFCLLVVVLSLPPGRLRFAAVVIPLALLAVVNKETSIFLAPAAVCRQVMIAPQMSLRARIRARRFEVVVAAVATFAAAGIYLAMRASNPAGHIHSLAEIFRMNLHPKLLLLVGFYLVPILILLAAVWKRVGLHWLWVAPFVVAYLAFGVWIEIRVLLPLVALGLAQLARVMGRDDRPIAMPADHPAGSNA
jgi:hypothetical protein